MVVLAAACTSSMTVSSPTTTTTTPPAVRVVMRSGCPEQIARDKDVENPSSALGQTLLPSAEPTGALWCTYATLRLPAALQTQRRLTAPEAVSLARVINRLHLGIPDPNAPRTCPPDKGTADILVFSYSGKPDVDLWWYSSGCQGLDNGERTAVEGGNPSFGHFMDAMQQLRAAHP
jgi:hypothetical protein